MDLLSLINETVDKSIDLLGLIKIMKEQLINLVKENNSLKIQIAEKDKLIGPHKKDAKDG